jgi:tetratricopeptide (TPR) repeat protein
MLAALPGGARDLPARQRTLSAAIRWSYDLLSPPEQSLFAALSVFRRGATWDAIQSVCTPSPHAPLIDRLSSLVEKNLVLVGETPQGELRFSMLETIRAFAAGCLQASAAAEITHQRHAAYFTELVEHASEEIRDRRQAYWYPRLQQEQDNLRAVLEWSLSGPEIEYGVRTATGLRDFWFYNGFLAESRRWFNLALQVTTGDRTALRAGILMASGGNAFVEYDAARGNAELLQAIQIYEQLGDERMLAWARIKLSIYSIEAPEQYDAGIALCRQGLEVFMRLGDLPGIAQAYNILGELARLVGDYAAAETYYLTCRDVSEETGELMRVAMSDTNLGFIAYHKGRYRQSAELIQLGLRAIHSLQNDYGITTMMGSLAGPLAQISEVDRAARLLGASFALLEASSARFQPSDMPEINLFMHTTREIMGAERFDQAYQAGRSLSQAEALTLALSPLPA